MKDKSKKSTYSTTFGVDPYTYNALGSVSEINLNGESKIVNTYDDLQRISSSSYMLGTSELKKLEYNLTSDNKLSKVLIKKNGDAVMN